MKTDDLADLNPTDSQRAHRARKKNRAKVIERAWHYFEESPSGPPLAELIDKLDWDLAFHPATIRQYLRSAASSAPNTPFELFEDDDEITHIRPKPSAMRRRQREKGDGHA